MQAVVKKLKSLQLGDTLIRRNPMFYGQARSTVQHLLQADLDERQRWTQERLARVLAHAARTGYGQRIKAGTRLDAWPWLEKSQVRRAPRAFRSRGLLRVGASTGGTSGAPLQLVRSLRSVVFEQACLDEMMNLLGVDAQQRCAVLRTDSIKDPNDFTPPFWASAGGGKRLVLSSSHLNADTIEHYARALAEFKPQYLLGYPTSLEALCLLLKRSDRQLNIPAVMCSSEVLHPSVWQAAQQALGCRLLDYYGQAERVAFAYALSAGSYRFLPGYAHVEFIQGEREGDHRLYEVVGTSLWNLAMPLVRYRTGDLVRVPADWGEQEMQELALGMRSFSGVLGRDSDILLTPEGVKVAGISHFHRDVPNIARIQVIQETPSKVRVNVLAERGFGAAGEEHLMRNIRQKLPLSVTVEIREVAALERTARGKTPFVIHRPAVRQAIQAVRDRTGGVQ